MATKAPPPTTTTSSPQTTYTGTSTTDTSKAPVLPPELAQWMVPGSTGILPGNTSQSTSAIDQLARFFHIDPKDKNLEAEVIKALANHYGVSEQITTPASEDVETTPATERPRGPGRGGDVEEPAKSAEIATPGGQDPNAESLAVIAKAAGVSSADLSSIAGQLIGPTGVTTPGVAPGPARERTAGEEYSNFVKALSSTATKAWTPGGPQETFKAYMSSWLEKGNYLNSSANGGTPDDTSIAKAYGDLLKSAQQGNTTVQKAYDANNAGANTPSGAAPTQTVSETAAFVQGMGEKLGIYLSPADITKISNMYQQDVTDSGGPTTVEDEIKNTVVQYFNPNDPRNPPGAASDMYQEVLASANAYGIPVASADITKWVTDGIKNSAGDSYSIAQAATDTAAAATTTFQEQAAGLYPNLANQIKAGQTVSTLIAPYNSITSELTGVPTTTLSDPGSAPGGVTGQYYKFLQGGTAPPAGTTSASSGAQSPGMMTLDQWKQYVMSTPSYGFQNTQGGKNLASQFTSAILNEFGKVNTGSNQQGAFGNISPSSALAANTQ